MPARPHLSNPLRELIVVWSIRDKKPPATVAQLLQCDVSTVYNVLRRFKKTGNPHALPRGRPRYVLNELDVRWLLSLLRANPALFLDELQLRLWNNRQVWVSIATISRTLERHGWSHKVLSKQAAERKALLRAIWLAEYGHLPASCFVWLDESGVDDRDHFRNWGWAPCGEAPIRSDPFTRDGRLTMIPALTFEGVIAMDIFDGGVGKEQFFIFLRQQVIPLLNPYRPENPLPRSVVVLDNCSIHHDEEVRALIEGMAGAKLIYLPPYSPDMNPIEQSFSCIKAWLRRYENGALSMQERMWYMYQAAMAITSADALGWIRNCGYHIDVET